MNQTYPIHIAREIDRRWDRRYHAEPRQAQNDNQAGGLCPLCGGFASSAPQGVEYYAKGLVQREWLCQACGHDWVTVVHVHA